MIKSFAKYKNYRLNQLINSDYELSYLADEFVKDDTLLNITCIKKVEKDDIKYSILRDHHTKAWFFTSKNIFILNLPRAKYKDFYTEYKNSNNFKFIVYIKHRTGYIDEDLKSELIIFCVSHIINDDNYKIFEEIYKKWSKKSFYILSKRLNYFLLLNTSYIDLIAKEKPKLMGINVLGNGLDISKNYEIMNFILSWINCDHKNLPYHYLVTNK